MKQKVTEKGRVFEGTEKIFLADLRKQQWLHTLRASGLRNPAHCLKAREKGKNRTFFAGFFY
ncbi:hypothetical protein [Halalkalibacter alkalisediminis]|uniref:Transposase n=1 Tax=Halalkalibacter alkalisediminis TaxID=935616 RepID=A0ABV6NM61_9BACI|nr:hypothetical protein [Halalkalibacter alkalisediminis]